MTILLTSALIALIALLPATASHAQPMAKPKNLGVAGLWEGTNTGFENGVFRVREIRFSIAKTNGVALTGTKSWRDLGGTWSAEEPFQGVLYKSGELHAVDSDGYIIGRLVSPTRIRATYLEAGEDQAAFVLNLTKASR